MENQIKYMYVELENQIGSSLKVDFDEDLLDTLIKEDKWIELIRETNDKKDQHFIYPPNRQVIRSINWIE